MESLLHLRGAAVAGQLPEIADGDGLNGNLFRGHLHHVNVPLAAASAPELRNGDAIVGAQHPAVGARREARANHSARGLFEAERAWSHFARAFPWHFGQLRLRHEL